MRIKKNNIRGVDFIYNNANKIIDIIIKDFKFIYKNEFRLCVSENVYISWK
jgi:hypothetical protein